MTYHLGKEATSRTVLKKKKKIYIYIYIYIYIQKAERGSPRLIKHAEMDSAVCV